MTHLALVSGPDLGHALVVLGLARGLAATGHDITVVTGEQRADLVAAEGHRFVALPLLAAEDDRGDFGHRLWQRAGQMAPALRDLLAPLAVDALVVDTLTTVGVFVAELLGLPWVEVSPHHLLDPDPLVAPIGMGLGPARTATRRRQDAEIRRAQAADVAAGHRLRDEARAELGLPSRPPPPPLVRLFQTLPGLEPRRSRWPADAHVVGQLAIDPPLPPVTPPAGDGPLVLVSDSTASSLPAPLGRMAVDALGGSDVRLVVTGTVDGEVPAGVVVATAPHEPLLEVADVAVTAGGGGFTAKALTRGVPLVVVPLAGDQQETAGRVARSGAGVWLPPEEASPAALRAAVTRVRSDASYRAAARRLAAGAEGLGADHAARLLQRAMAGSGVGGVAP